MINLGYYKHYKGGVYIVIGEVCHSETLESYVLYKSIHDSSKIWIRPTEMFKEYVDINGSSVKRFLKISYKEFLIEKYGERKCLID